MNNPYWGGSTLPFCFLVSLTQWQQHRSFTILPLLNVADRKVCGLKPPLPQVVSCSRIAFHLQLKYRKEQSPVGEKGRGKQDLTGIILLHSTTCFMLLTAENSFSFPVLSDCHFFQRVTLLEVLRDMHAFFQKQF